MSSGSASGTFTVIIIYTGSIDATSLDPGAFHEVFTAQDATAVAQASPSAIELTFAADVGSGTEVDYSGSTPGVLTPDSVAI